ncbi:MAG: hypothetical protein H8K03_20205 [Nitrospira sp.]|jgi:hypothetical protein|nr:hypothetical protein [Nitrospira sp. BO4]
MNDDDLSGRSPEELKAKCFAAMTVVFGISSEEAEAIYQQVMNEPSSQRYRNLAWISGHPWRAGLYWYRKHVGDTPFIVEVSKLETGALRARDLDQGTRWVTWNGQWAGPLEPPS